MKTMNKQRNQTSLYITRRDGVMLNAAAQSFLAKIPSHGADSRETHNAQSGQPASPAHHAYALLYAPRRCHLALLKTGGKFYGASFSHSNGALHEEAINPDSIYEARIFNSHAELRWLNHTDKEGGACVVLSEADVSDFFSTGNQANQPDIESPAVPHKMFDTITDRTYLIWGESTKHTEDSWTQFATARIGAFAVPVGNLKQHSRAHFTAVEYLKIYTDGNVGVFDERLTGIAAHKN